jgi:DNA invertase Pin-like site-specific DNA recombinase
VKNTQKNLPVGKTCKYKEVKMKTAAAYIRVSTDDQIEYSPDSQLKAIRDYARKNDMILPEEFVFIDEGISGRKAEKRPEFMKMIGTAKMKPKQFDVILLWKFSRFARNREDSIVYKSMLRKQCGIDVISVSEQLGEDKTSILIEALIEAMDEYYSINLAEEVRRGMTEKAQRGEVVSAPPFGYDIKDNVFIPDPEAAPIVKMIFDKYLKGQGCLEIAKELNKMGIKTKHGNKWENRGVEYVLRNVVYTGKLTWTPIKTKTRDYNCKDTIISRGMHEPIIDQETFDKVQNMILEKKKLFPKHSRQSSNEFMLKGFLKCSNCGGALVYATNNRVQCNRYSKGTCEVSHSVSLSKLNSSVISALKSDLETQQFKIYKKAAEEQDNKDITPTLIAKERKKLERVKDAYEAGIDSLEEYRINKEKILKTIAELEKNKKPESSQKDDFQKLSKTIKKSLDILEDENCSESIKNITLRSFVRQIVYMKKTQSIEILYQI